MNEQSCKILTKFIGEFYHDYTVGYKTGGLSKCSCGLQGCIVLDSCSKQNRTFHTPADMQVVKNELERRGWLMEFSQWAWERESHFTTDLRKVFWEEPYITWFYRLFSETPDGYRLCVLAAEFLKQKLELFCCCFNEMLQI